MKPKVRRLHTLKSDEPDLQESAVLKKIIAYQRKLLVLQLAFISLSPPCLKWSQFRVRVIFTQFPLTLNS